MAKGKNRTIVKYVKAERHRSRGFNTQSLFKILRLVALGAPAAGIAMSNWTAADKLTVGLRQYTGFDRTTGTFQFAELAKGWGPFIGTSVITYGVPKLLGMLRRL